MPINPLISRYVDGVIVGDAGRKLRKSGRSAGKPGTKMALRIKSRLDGEDPRQGWHNKRVSSGKRLTGRMIRRQFETQDGRCHYCDVLFSHRPAKYLEAELQRYQQQMGRKCLSLPPYKRRSYHIEHLTPVFRGGDNRAENIVLACRACNMAKFTMTEAEFRKFRAAQEKARPGMSVVPVEAKASSPDSFRVAKA